MRRSMRWGLLAAGVAILWLGGVARAEVSTNLAGSILVFPKVIANGSRDTIIQISNVSNSLVRAHCFYVNATLKDPTQPEGALNKRLWQEVDFDITLTKQQPTHWVVSQGRRVNPLDPACDNTTPDCNGAGFDPGLVPPVVPDFEGELKCIEVDDSGAPLSGNHLKGEATLVVTGLSKTSGMEGTETLQFGDLAQYNAIAILGSENNGDGTLVLGGGQCVGDGAANGQICQSDADCGDASPCALEYNACPAAWTLNHFADAAPNPIIESVRLGPNHTEYPDNEPSEVYTQLTVVPCTENFETQQPTSVTLQFQTWDEFESQFSASTTVTCWGNFFLSDMGAPSLTFPGTTLPDPQGTMFLQTRIRSANGTSSGFLMVAETLLTAKTSDPGIRYTSTAAANAFVEGERTTPDIITIPADQLLP
jgi:hypothetical protein